MIRALLLIGSIFLAAAPDSVGAQSQMLANYRVGTHGCASEGLSALIELGHTDREELIRWASEKCDGTMRLYLTSYLKLSQQEAQKITRAQMEQVVDRKLVGEKR